MTELMNDRGAEAAAKHGFVRSPHWPTVEREFRAKNPVCAACGGGEDAHAGLQVHHVNPFHFVKAVGRHDLELDERNLITLGEAEHDRPVEDHHLLLGHDGNFQSDNPNVRADCDTFRGMAADAIRTDPRWVAARAGRLKVLSEWTPDDLRVYRVRLDALLPPDPAVLSRFGVAVTEIGG